MPTGECQGAPFTLSPTATKLFTTGLPLVSSELATIFSEGERPESTRATIFSEAQRAGMLEPRAALGIRHNPIPAPTRRADRADLHRVRMCLDDGRHSHTFTGLVV